MRMDQKEYAIKNISGNCVLQWKSRTHFNETEQKMQEIQPFFFFQIEKEGRKESLE